MLLILPMWQLRLFSAAGQATLSSLMLTTLSLFSCSPECLRAQPWCTYNGWLWKPKPSLPSSLLPAAQWRPVFWPWLLPWVISVHIHMETHTTQMHLMPSSVSLFLPFDSFSLVRGLGDQMSTLLCRLFCTEEQRPTISLYISCLFLYAPFTPPNFLSNPFFF